MEENIRKSFWIDAATGGSVIGLTVVAIFYIWTLAGLGQGIIADLLIFVVMGFFIYRFGHKRAFKYGKEGFSFSQSMSFILTMMIFTGVIYGLAYFLMANYFSPESFEKALEVVAPSRDDEREIVSMMHRPLMVIFVGILTMELYGGLIGLFASSFIKRKPRPEEIADEQQ